MDINFDRNIENLKKLQKIDGNVHKLNKWLDELPQQLQPVKDEFDSVSQQLSVLTNEKNELDIQKNKNEADLNESVELLRTREARLYALKTNKEYQAALKEISEGKLINKEREEKVLAAMSRIDEINENIKQLSHEFADKKDRYEKTLSEVNEEESRIKEQLEEDHNARPAVVACIDKKLLSKYDFIRRCYVDVLASINDGACQGCLRRIPPQMLNEMLRQTELRSCPSCQRLIYYVKPVDESEVEGDVANNAHDNTQEV